MIPETILRTMLSVAGVLVAGWGFMLLADLDRSGLMSAAIWAGGAVVVHDAILAPLTVAAGIGVARLAPRGTRRPIALVLAVWAVLTVAVANVTFAPGGADGNPSLLTGDYVAWWSAGTGLAIVLVAGLVWRGFATRRGGDRRRSGDHVDDEATRPTETD